MQYNISPETIAKDNNGNPIVLNVDLDKLVHGSENTEFASKNNYALASSGVCFHKENQGVIPWLCETLYSQRKQIKHRMLTTKNEHEKILLELEKRKQTNNV